MLQAFSCDFYIPIKQHTFISGHIPLIEEFCTKYRVIDGNIPPIYSKSFKMGHFDLP